MKINIDPPTDWTPNAQDGTDNVEQDIISAKELYKHTDWDAAVGCANSQELHQRQTSCILIKVGREFPAGSFRLYVC